MFCLFGTVPACGVGWTDRQTHDDSIYCASIASHDKTVSHDSDHTSFRGGLSSVG